MLCTLKGGSTEHVRTSFGSVRTFREWPRCGDGVPENSARRHPTLRPIPPLLLSHYFRIIVLSLLVIYYLRRLPDVLYPLPYLRSDHLHSTIDAQPMSMPPLYYEQLVFAISMWCCLPPRFFWGADGNSENTHKVWGRDA